MKPLAQHGKAAVKRFQQALMLLAACISIVCAAFAQQQKSIKLPPDDSTAHLKPGPGREVAERNCRSCHSTDYIVWQPKFDVARWQGEVNKMISTYGARITETDARTIAEYLGKAYGVESDGANRK